MYAEGLGDIPGYVRMCLCRAPKQNHTICLRSPQTNFGFASLLGHRSDSSLKWERRPPQSLRSFFAMDRRLRFLVPFLVWLVADLHPEVDMCDNRQPQTICICRKRAEYGFGEHPLAQNQYMQENILGEFNFWANTCGACIRSRANTGKYF